MGGRTDVQWRFLVKQGNQHAVMGRGQVLRDKKGGFSVRLARCQQRFEGFQATG
jgi:hypothetical protein